MPIAICSQIAAALKTASGFFLSRQLH